MTYGRSNAGGGGGDRRPGDSGPQRPAGPPSGGSALAPEQVRRIFTPEGYLAVNELGERLGRMLSRDGASSSQIRNILNSLQAISETWDTLDQTEQQKMERGRQIGRLKPNLLYLAARETNRTKKDLLVGLATTLSHGIDAVLESTTDMKQRYSALVDLVEAITAYHRVNAANS